MARGTTVARGKHGRKVYAEKKAVKAAADAKRLAEMNVAATKIQVYARGKHGRKVFKTAKAAKEAADLAKAQWEAAMRFSLGVLQVHHNDVPEVTRQSRAGVNDARKELERFWASMGQLATPGGTPIKQDMGSLEA